MPAPPPTEVKTKFEWKEGVTYFSRRDVESGITKLPCPKEEMTEVNDMFIAFVKSIPGAELGAFIALSTSKINPFFPQPFLPRDATFENNGYYVPNEFSKFIWENWYSQLVEFLRDYGADIQTT